MQGGGGVGGDRWACAIASCCRGYIVTSFKDATVIILIKVNLKRAPHGISNLK